MPKALKSSPKSNKSPNLVTLTTTDWPNCMLTKARRHVDLKTLVRFVKQIKYRLIVCVYFVIKNKCTVNLPFGQSASCFSLCILTIDNSVNPQFGLSVSYGQNDFNIFYFCTVLMIPDFNKCWFNAAIWYCRNFLTVQAGRLVRQ